MKKDNRKESQILKAAGKIVKMEAKRVNSDWPPICAGFLHQPKRPCKK